MLFSQAVISGLMSGGLYALLGSSVVLVFRATGLINLALGESYAIAGVVASAMAAAALPYWLALSGGWASAIMFSLGMQFFFLRRRSHWPTSGLILLTLGIAFVLRGIMVLIIGPDAVSFPRLFVGSPLHVAGGVMPIQGLALILFGTAAPILVWLFLVRTEQGKTLIATSENPDAAQLLGVNVEASRYIAYGLAGILAGSAALLLVPLVSVDFQVGLAMTLRGFIAAAISGMSPRGVVIAGFGLGLFEAMLAGYIGSLFQDPIIFAVLIGIALWQSRNILHGGARRA